MENNLKIVACGQWFCSSVPELAMCLFLHLIGITPRTPKQFSRWSLRKWRFTSISRQAFVDGGAVWDFGPTLRNLILELFPLGKIFQPDDSWKKRASSKMQAFLWLFWESFVSPCALTSPHTREGNSVMLVSIPVSSPHRFSIINAFISFSFL